MGLFWKSKKNKLKVQYAEARAKANKALNEIKLKEQHDNLFLEYKGIINGNYQFNVVSYVDDMGDEGHSLEDLIKMDNLVRVEEWNYSQIFKCEIVEIGVAKYCNNKVIGSKDADKIVRYLIN